VYTLAHACCLPLTTTARVDWQQLLLVVVVDGR